jgi:hypothetical protein
VGCVVELTVMPHSRLEKRANLPRSSTIYIS